MSSVTPELRKRSARFWKLLLIAMSMAVFGISPAGSLIGLDIPHSLAAAVKKDKSDMNGDGLVDLADLQLFSQEQIGPDWTDVDWCQWIADNPQSEPHYVQLYEFIRSYFQCASSVPILSNPTVSGINIPSATMGATIVSDGGSPVIERGTVWNTTGPPIMENQLAEGGTALGPFSHARTDLTDVPFGARVYFRGYAVNSVGIGYSPESSFVVEDPLAVKHSNDYPTRLALGPSGHLYVSDPKVGSVFIYDNYLQLTGELNGLFSPRGVAVDSAGFIYVGNSGINVVEKYDPQGKLVATIGQGMIRMPTDLTLDQNDNLYVADSQSDLVWVFKADGEILRTIRKGGLKSPMAVEVSYYDDGTGQPIGEVFVADKGNYLVKVFDLQGNLLRSFGGFPTKGGMLGTTWYWKGKFISLQSLAVDAQGNLHALDIYMNRVQILNPVTGAYIADYGEPGTGAGQLKLPLDIIINNGGDVIVANSDNKRVEVIYTIP